MKGDFSDQWEFGDFSLDAERKVLRHKGTAVQMPLKEVELLSALVRRGGEMVTKEELLDEIWEDSFVGENNLSRHVYLLRRTLKDIGADQGLIENVPRRGYRFAGEVRPIAADEILVERRTQARTLIEMQETGTPSRLRWTVLLVAALVLCSVSAVFIYRSVRPTPLLTVNSIAVMPFKTVAADTSPHSGAGLADILTTRLGNLKSIRVVPGSAVRGPVEPDATAIGSRLNVDAVLDGTIYRVGDRVRVSARLVKAGDGHVIWSGEFERLANDELSLQNEIAGQIVPLIALNLSGEERDAIAKKYTESADAYELYINGRYEWNKRSNPGMSEAQRLFRNAIAADPDFAFAYVGLADTLLTSLPYRREAEAVVEKALKLDPNLGEAHASLGFYHMFHNWNWDAADASLKKAIELNPNYATAHHWYATLLSIKGDMSGAKAEMRKALELNPVSPNFLADLGQLHYFSGEHAEAESYCLKALEIDPDFLFAHEYLHYIYLETGRHEEAVAELARADAINAAYTEAQKPVSDRLAEHTRVFRAQGMTGYYEYRYPEALRSPEIFYFQAMKHALAGDNQKALDYLEKSADQRNFQAAFVKANPMFANLRSEQRYQAILRKMGLV